MREVVFIHRDTKGAAALLEVAVERIEAFTRMAGGDPRAVVNQVWKLYAEQSDALGLWVLVEPDDTVVGHILMDIRGWDGHQVAWVLQCKMDVGHDALSEAEIARIIKGLDAWVAHWNLLAMQAKRPDLAVGEYLFSTPRETEAWARAFGFQKHRDLRRRSLPAS